MEYEFLSDEQLHNIIVQATRNRARELILADKRIHSRSLPPEIAQLTTLERLYLQETFLDYLPAEIGQLTNLVYIDLRFTCLKTLPPEFGNLTKLEELYLSSKHLITIPGEIGRLTNLKRLQLGGLEAGPLPFSQGLWDDPEISELKELPSEISNLLNLEYLNLNCNRLSEIPSSICNLHNLQTLCLDENENNLNIPIEILMKENAPEIINYYFHLQKTNRKHLNEAKILVGEGGVNSISGSGKKVIVKRRSQMDCEVSLSKLIQHVRQELHEAAEQRRAAGEKAFFRVETVTIELHAVVTSSKEGKGGVDLKVVTVGGQKLYSEQEIQKITVLLRAKLPDEPQYDDDLETMVR